MAGDFAAIKFSLDPSSVSNISSQLDSVINKYTGKTFQIKFQADTQALGNMANAFKQVENAANSAGQTQVRSAQQAVQAQQQMAALLRTIQTQINQSSLKQSKLVDTEQLNAAKAALKDLQQAFAQFENLDLSRYGKGGNLTFTTEQLNQFNQLSRALEKYRSELKGAETASKEASVAINAMAGAKLLRTNFLSWWDKYRDTISRSGESAKTASELIDRLNHMAANGGSASAFRQLKTDIADFQSQEVAAGRTHESFLQKIQSGFSGKLFYGIMATGAMYARQALRDMVANVTEIDSAMTQLQIVTGATESQMNQFFTTSSDLAQRLGQSITDVLSSVETFSRLGFNLPDASALAEYAGVLANVASVDVSEATTGLTSIIKGFDLEVSDAEHVADVLVQVGQKYAISAGEIMSAAERGGAALAATGTSFEKSVALFAAANAALQNSEKVGTVFQSLSARIRGSKSELESLGEEFEDVAEGFSKYRDEIKALTNVDGTGGFDIMADAAKGEFKDIYDIFVGIAEVWDKLSETSQARVAEILGGTRNFSAISSIITNIADATGALEDAMNSAGVAMKANKTYMDSIEGKVGQLQASFQVFSHDVLSSDTSKFFVDLAKSVVDVATALAKVNMLLPAIVAGFAAIKGVGGLKVTSSRLTTAPTKFSPARVQILWRQEQASA